MKFTPRPYQEMIRDFELEHKRCLIFSGMGTGKTASTATALETLTLLDDSPTLVLAPLRVASTTWPDEFKKWDHLQGLEVAPIIGTEKQRRTALRKDAQVFTTNYENVPWLVETYGGRWPFKKVICDESTKLKGFRLRQGTKRAKALGRVAHTLVDRLVLLTGTPCPNGLLDLWAQAWFCDKGERLGRTFDAYKTRFFRPNFNGFGVTPLDGAQDEIQSLLRDICLTIDAKDWFDLDDPIVNNIFVDLPPKARKIYNDLEKEMYTSLGGHEVEAFNAAARTIKCLQASAGALYVGEGNNKEYIEIHDEKLKALEDVVEEAAGMPVLVAYTLKSDLARLLKRFPEGRHLDKNPQTIADWNAGKIPMLFAHPQSAAHGLNLQYGGNIVVMFNPDWNLENVQQVLERIGPVRQKQAGLDRPVFIHNILAKDTVDELVFERLETKREVQDLLLESMKQKGYRA